MEGIPYKATLGSLVYVMVETRIDLASMVSIVSQFISGVGLPYWIVVKCITSYLKDTLDFKLCLKYKDIVDFVISIGQEM